MYTAVMVLDVIHTTCRGKTWTPRKLVTPYASEQQREVQPKESLTIQRRRRMLKNERTF